MQRVEGEADVGDTSVPSRARRMPHAQIDSGQFRLNHPARRFPITQLSTCSWLPSVCWLVLSTWLFVQFPGAPLLAQAAETGKQVSATTEGAGRSAGRAVEAGTGLTLGEPSIGWQGRYKLGVWTPVAIPIHAGSYSGPVAIELTAIDADDLQCQLQYPQVELQAGQTTVWRGWVRWGRRDAGLRLRLVDEERVVLEQSWRGAELSGALGPAEQLVVVWGPAQSLRATADRRSQSAREPMVVVTPDPAKFPVDALSYDGVDLVVVSLGASGAGGISEAAPGQMTVEQWGALREWVRLGGRLLTYGARGLDRPVIDGHPLLELMPGSVERITAQRQTSALEGFVGGGEPLSRFVAPGELNFSLPAVVLRETVGRVVVTEGSGENRVPLIVQRPVGLGHTTFVGLDLDQFPFTEWANTNRLIDRLLDLTLGEAYQQQDEGSQRIAHAGYADLAGQLRVGLDRFSGVAVTSFSWVALLIAVYILLIGPIDYWLLRRWNRRFVWTWATFPLLVVSGSGLAWTLARQWKGTERRLNQIDVIDWDIASGQVRGTHWFQLFTPVSERQSWRLELGEPWRAGEGGGTWLTWLGFPGSSFGGLHNPPSRLGHELGYAAPVTRDAAGRWQAEMRDVPMDAASSRGLSGRWWHTVGAPEIGKLTANTAGELAGEVRNPFPFPLSRLWLLHGRWVYELDELPGGGTWTLNTRTLPKTLEYLLTRRRVEGGKDRGTPWDVQSTDVGRIVQMIGFHSAAGGSSYTGLMNRYHADLDLSQLLKLDRAVLVGWAKEPAGRLWSPTEALESQQHWAMYRLVLPVASGK
ncbi:MAG: hypothetical protein U0795_09700 [Pirellulales bacterium]